MFTVLTRKQKLSGAEKCAHTQTPLTGLMSSSSWWNWVSKNIIIPPHVIWKGREKEQKRRHTWDFLRHKHGSIGFQASLLHRHMCTCTSTYMYTYVCIHTLLGFLARIPPLVEGYGEAYVFGSKSSANWVRKSYKEMTHLITSTL